MQEPKKVQFNIKNSTTREVSIDLFNASSITPITNETQFQAGATNTLSPFYDVNNGFYNLLTNENVFLNIDEGISVVNQENSTSSIFLSSPVNSMRGIALNTTNNNLYIGNNKNSNTETTILVLDAITYTQINEIIIPFSPSAILDICYSPVNNYIYANVLDITTAENSIIYIDCFTNLVVGSILLGSNEINNITYCSVNNTIYSTITNTSETYILINCYTNTYTIFTTANVGDDSQSDLLYNASTNCIYYYTYNTNIANWFFNVLDCNTNTIIYSYLIGDISYIGYSYYGLTLNSSLNIIYFLDYNGVNYFISVFDCNNNTITTPLLNITTPSVYVFEYNPYFETLNIFETTNQILSVINTTTLEITTYQNALNELAGIIYNENDGFYYLTGKNAFNNGVVVKYKDGIAYITGNEYSVGWNNPIFIPNKNSIILVNVTDYTNYNITQGESSGIVSLGDWVTYNIYEVGNLYSFNFINSSIYTYVNVLAGNLIQSINQNALYPSGYTTQFLISNTGVLNNVGINVSRPISNQYALSSVNYLNPISVTANTIVFSAYDSVLNSLHFQNYSLCKFNLTNNNWDNLVEVADTSKSVMCLNIINGNIYVCMNSSNNGDNFWYILNSKTYEIIDTFKGVNFSKYMSFNSIKNIIYSTYNTFIYIIDCNSNEIINTIDLNILTGVSTHPYGIVYVENNNSLYVNCAGGGGVDGVLVLDADNYTLINTILENDIDFYSYSSVYSPIQNKIYRPLSRGFDVDIIDCATNTSLGVITLTTISPYNPVYNYIDDKVYFIHVGLKNITILDCATETTTEIVGYYAGGINNSFNQGTGFNSSVLDIQIQIDNKLLVGGDFIDYNGDANHIVRLNSDGSKDSSFIDIGLDSSVLAISLQSDGKILIGGSFTSYNFGVDSANCILRLNSDGSADTSFVIGTGFNDYISTICIQSDGKILVGGAFTNYDGNPINRVIRLNSDGSIDTSFNIGTGFDSYVLNIEVQLDGKILIGGGYLSYNGTPANYIIRLNSDGSIDTSFLTGTGFNSEVRIIQIQIDGKILIGGSYSSYNGTPANYIIRLNSDGSIDTSFNIGTGFNNIIFDIKVQSDGKILVGGLFNSYNGLNCNRVAILNSDGSYDSNYDFSIGANNVIYAITIIENNNFYIGGNLTSYDNTSVGYIASVHSTSYYAQPQTPPQSIVYNGDNNSVILFTDEYPVLGAGSYSYVYSFDCNTLAETIIDKSIPYENYTSVENTTYSPVNNNYYQLINDNTSDCYIVIYDGSTNLEINRVLLSQQNLEVSEYCTYNNYIYIGGNIDYIIVFDCNTNTELTPIVISGGIGFIVNLTFNSINNLLYCIGDTSGINIIDVITNLETTTLPTISSNFDVIDSCFDLINNQIIYAKNFTTTSEIIFFDCNLENTNVIDTYTLYDLIPNFIVYNPLNNLIYCTAINSSLTKNSLLIINPLTYSVSQIIELNQETSVNLKYSEFRLALNTIENTIFIASNRYDNIENGFYIFDCNTNEIISTNTFKVGTTDFSLSSLNNNIASVFYNQNYNSFVAFHYYNDSNSLINGFAISSFTKQNYLSNESFFPIVESGICKIVRYDCNINRIMETIYTAPAETPYIGKMVYNPNNNYLYFVQYESQTAFTGTKSIGVLNLTDNTLVTTLYPTLITGLFPNSYSDLIDIVLNPFSNVIQVANTYSDGTTDSGNIIVIDCNTNTISQYVSTGNGVEFLTYNSALNTIAYGGIQQTGTNNFYFGSLAGTSNFTIEGGSVNYDFFVQGLNNDPKKIEEIEIEMPQRYLVNPVNVQYKDANGISDLKPYLPNTEIDAFQKAPNRAIVKFGDDYIMNINTQIVNFILPPLSETILVITYTELLKSDMLDMVVYEDERKAKYKINQSLDGKITAEKYWGAKKMPKELHLSSDWLTEMRKRFKKVEVIEYDQPKLAGGTIQTRQVYQELFGFSKQVKERHIGITEAPKFKKGVKVKLATKKQPIKPIMEDVQVEEVFQDMLRVNAHEITLESKIIECQNPKCNWSWDRKDGGDDLFICHKCGTDNEKFYKNGNLISPLEMPLYKQTIKPREVEMTTEEVFQEMLSVNAHEIKLNRIKVPKIKGVKPIQVQLDDLSPVDVFNRSFEDYGSGYLIGIKTPCKEEEKKDEYIYGVYYIKPIDDRFTAFRHSGDIPLKIELTNDWFNDLKRNFDDVQIIAIVKKKK